MPYYSSLFFFYKSICCGEIERHIVRDVGREIEEGKGKQWIFQMGGVERWVYSTLTRQVPWYHSRYEPSRQFTRWDYTETGGLISDTYLNGITIKVTKKKPFSRKKWFLVIFASENLPYTCFGFVFAQITSRDFLHPRKFWDCVRSGELGL